LSLLPVAPLPATSFALSFVVWITARIHQDPQGQTLAAVHLVPRPRASITERR
jgi:hypothetical protein